MGKSKASLPVTPKGGARHVVIDATRSKIYGEKTRQNELCKRRTWRKLHLAVAEQTKELLATALSLNDKDSQRLDPLLGAIDDEVEPV